ncbi:D-alanyl-D-alanine carboxypeptidase family protein [Paenibacillus sp. FJAT-26967]|uniref:D-alanyl-D-alanine carboxypeptidase family protein n=1 Tax=Paenibacillus sp. FJAT-26967 TaxID=1729690 RepID=UPI000837E87B|nr:D-alanyl-D-alanine carboxypeptidase family protein [Paenibacillus sp. FJAT-26967]
MKLRIAAFLIGSLAVLLLVSLLAEPWNTIKPHAAFAWNSLRTKVIGNVILPGDLEGEAALLLDADSGSVLYDKNENLRLYPASTTKIMTTLIALEKGDLDQQIIVGDEIRESDPGESSAGLREGQRLTLRDLIAAMMLPSGNDAARTVACYIARKDSGQELTAQQSIRYFASLMNTKARKIGAKDSHFMNPHGLHHDDHYTTAHDIALITQIAMKNETFRSIVDEPRHTAISAGTSISFENRNQLLLQDGEFYFQGVNGVKTGFTDEAGYCLVSSAGRDGRNLIAVVLKSTRSGIWTDSQKLLRYGFKA